MIKYNRPHVLKLAEMDAAIVIKSDGTLEASLPEVTSEEVPENVFTGAALVYALRNPEICEMIYQNFAQECVRQRGNEEFSTTLYH